MTTRQNSTHRDLISAWLMSGRKMKREINIIAAPADTLEWDPETIQIKGFSKGITEIQWLLVALVLLYLVLAGETDLANQIPTLVGIGIYFVFTLGVNYLAFFRLSKRWVMALQTWAMIIFITSSLHFTGSLDGPMVNLYLLPVIVSALALGRLTTVLQVAAVTACFLLLLSMNRVTEWLTPGDLGLLSAYGAMFLLVGYLTIMLADAIHFANSRMRKLARTDQLTGLLNMPTFRVVAHSLYSRALRNNQPFVIVMADMDNLKKINDHYGHSAGDQAIIETAASMQNAMRESDVLARYGGDEFVMFLPDTPLQGALTLINRLLADGSHNTPPPGSGDTVKPVFSVGVAVYPNHGSTVEELLEKADKALYQSKKNGGNRVTTYTQDMA